MTRVLRLLVTYLVSHAYLRLGYPYLPYPPAPPIWNHNLQLIFNFLSSSNQRNISNAYNTPYRTGKNKFEEKD